MVSHAGLPHHGHLPKLNNLRAYTVCFFDPGQFVPMVKVVDAASDAEAIEDARIINPWTRREIWDRHRLVAQVESNGLGPPHESAAAP